MQERKIPAIVFTGGVDDGVRQDLWERKVFDYVLKSDPNSLEYVTNLVVRIALNKTTKVLVVDDSNTLRKMISNLLKTHQFEVHEAIDGLEALDVLGNHPDIKLIVIDYNMPNMDGVELTVAVREKYDRGRIAVIGLSTSGNAGLSAKFLKNGANDFICKPFEAEEFYCRINQNIELLEHISLIRDLSHTAFLTGLYNRRYFIESRHRHYASALHGDKAIIVAMVDIDHFKNVNDTYGHDAGDDIIREVSGALKNGFRESDLVCRFGGEEFCIHLTNINEIEDIEVLFERVRNQVSRVEVQSGTQSISVTISVGVCAQWMNSLEEMIQAADAQLYEAKTAGRDRVKMIHTPIKEGMTTPARRAEDPLSVESTS